MRLPLPALLLTAALFALAPSAAQAAPLRAGAAAVDITPANGGTTLGFVRPDITVKGVHTRLTGRVIVLDDGDSRVALLATDLGFPLDKEGLIARLRPDGFTHETVFYTGTHTHSGPGSLAPWQTQQLAEAVRLAVRRLRPARAAWGATTVPGVARNRSIEAHLATHGIDQFYGEGDAADDPFGTEHTVDRRLRLLRIEGTDGRPLAAWLNFPVHLTTSTPAADLWDADLAGPAEQHLEDAVGGTDRHGPQGLREQGFVALFNNGSLGDLMPVFDSYNPTAVMDLQGARIASGARQAWEQAGRRLTTELPVDVRWTRICYCGQEVEAGRRVAANPIFGLPFLGGSEDGASIFHEPVATEGRRLPAELADPVQGRKIQAVPSELLDVHETQPEVHLVRLGDRLLVGAPGEPSVEMGRRFDAAVRPLLPAGVRDPVVVGLTNDYLGYLTTPEEYEMQHYEGGHTVFGIWTSTLMRQSFEALATAMRDGAPAPAPTVPGDLGDAGEAKPEVGDGGVAGAITTEPAELVRRFDVVDLGWKGAAGGVDRPADTAFIAVERQEGTSWRRVDSDLGLSIAWREVSEGAFAARYDVPGDLPTGTYRLRVASARYDLPSRPFSVAADDGLVPLGVVMRRLKGGRTRLLLTAQVPAPDPKRAIRFRATSPQGGRANLRLGRALLRARWSARLGGWSVVTRRRVRTGTPILVRAGSLRDAAGNRNGEAATLRVGTVERATWPTNMGVGGGRTPGVGGSGSFPP
ncbi:neutral/alkaline non-lysosomal ceramidase N-terminal domain-containing protein [Paraconexibacter sp.]|uniref:neutral/alkaline non-lysosomal ceramidase N-terminal domain-containing protein n=1 Tax=Paraconexibacter sp. TaxID=2949640 RepID=UPI00356497E4